MYVLALPLWLVTITAKVLLPQLKDLVPVPDTVASEVAAVAFTTTLVASVVAV